VNEEDRREYIRRVVDRAPPLSDETAAELRELLRPGVIASQTHIREEVKAA
jgi:hypothetical protein